MFPACRPDAPLHLGTSNDLMNGVFGIQHMHTAFSLRGSAFEIELNGQPADREALLDWRSGDRLGVILDSPLCALGASMLMQLVTTAYYDLRPGRREAPHYAEIYLFHVGGRYGDFSSFDIVPRREVFLPADASALLEAINDRAITHLAVPDGPSRPLAFPWTEADAARDRIRHCFAYSADGRANKADVTISSQDAELHHDVELALETVRLAENIERYMDAGDADVQLYSTRLAQRVRRRLEEVSQNDKMTARARYMSMFQGGVFRQTFRTISVNEALDRL
ncbi:hypothetical protein SPHS6_02167 [Sphingobium sp. S6]|nr:hypothetical protein SPHS8_01945 [Sphingobium sp. S8]CAD7338916.1 hypothetical protein SPHS6_02167 [Sphingobium sp. S6]